MAAQLWLVTADNPQGRGDHAPGEGDMAEIHRTVVRYLRHRRPLVAPTTLITERTILIGWSRHMGNRLLANIGQGHIEAWLDSITHLAPRTRRARFTIVRSFLAWCVDERLIARNHADRIPTPKVPRSTHRALNQQQTRALLDACATSRDRLIILLGLQLGLRRAEIAGLTVEDIDWHDRTLLVTGKGGHQRTLWIPDELAEAIEAYLADSPAIHGPLIRGDRYPTRPVAPPWVGRRVTVLCRAAGVKRQAWDGVSTHALRHTAGTDVARSTGGDVVAVRDFLGHASLATSQVYVAGDPLRLRSAIDGRRYLRAS